MVSMPRTKQYKEFNAILDILIQKNICLYFLFLFFY
jgi:hypothetical protein